jgi:hypothetical protein
MATAEQMLNEAQYAFANITFGESFSNARHAARAKSLARKIIRKFPATMEASEARAILRRLGEEAYTSEMPIRHRHVRQADHHGSWKPSPTPRTPRTPRVGQQAGRGDTLDWGGLVGLLLGLPKVIQFVLIAAGFVFFSLFGWLIVVPLVALVLFTGPFRSLLQPAQRDQLNDFIVRINALIEERSKPGGFS